MTAADDRFERMYEALAPALDRAGPANEALFLAKLALLLAHRLDDPDSFAACIEAALQDLPEGG